MKCTQQSHIQFKSLCKVAHFPVCSSTALVQDVSKQEYCGLDETCHFSNQRKAHLCHQRAQNLSPGMRSPSQGSSLPPTCGKGASIRSLPRTDCPTPWQQRSNRSTHQRGPLQHSQQLKLSRGIDGLQPSGGKETDDTLFPSLISFLGYLYSLGWKDNREHLLPLLFFWCCFVVIFALLSTP